MDKAELLSTFIEKVEQYARFRSYIEKAQGQQGKFSEAVIEKVCLDNELRSLETSEGIRPLIGDIEAIVEELVQQRDHIHETKAGADATMEEMQLRAAIGALSDEEFEEQTASLQEELAGAAEHLEGLNAELESFQTALDRWVELAVIAGHETGVSGTEPEPEVIHAEPEPEVIHAEPEFAASFDFEEEPDAGFDDGELFAEEDPVAEPELFGAHEEDFEESGPDLFGDLDIEEDVAVDFGDEAEPVSSAPASSAGEYAARVGMVEDMSAIFGDEDHDVPGSDHGAIEVGELAEDDGSVDIDIGVDEPVDDDLDILSEAGAEEVEIDLLSGESGGGVSMNFDENAEAKGPRRALLLYQEGTPEEQIYPFTSDVITIGRGRENDIQIKNDSKVSRYHCKIFRRGDNFYIEDNKSSNGSLVNGELITERRLFGGEEIVIGETFFRFRIME